jgi:hypothetical protein
MVVATVVLAVALVGAACSSSSDNASAAGGTGSTGGNGHTLRVPAQYPTVQKAVDAARPGDLVLVSPGVYHEAVTVTTHDLVIRGLDRNTTVLDGDFTKKNGIRGLGADGLAIENITARDYAENGFYWDGVKGYRGSYLTAYRNGDYGIYAYDSTNGLLESSYGSGSPDSGFYVGGCQPCDALIRNVVSEYNGIGYSGTNSGGNLTIADSTFRHNRVGIVPNSGSYEICYPERDDVIVGNLVYDNNQTDTGATDDARLIQNNGILIAGGWNNHILRNRVFNHALAGIALVPYAEQQPRDVVPTSDPGACANSRYQARATDVPDMVLWPAKGNTVEGNVVSESGMADLATADGAPGSGNCFADNTFTTSAPHDLEKLEPCTGTGRGDYKAGAFDLGTLVTRPAAPSGDFKASPVPPRQPNMPNPEHAPARPATSQPPKIAVDEIGVPPMPTNP